MSNLSRKRKAIALLIIRQEKIEHIRKKRKNKCYISNGSKPADLTPTKKIKSTIKNTANLIIPKRFELNGDNFSTLTFLKELRSSILTNHFRYIHLDHRAMESVDPPSVLMLIAEIMRGRSCSPDCRLTYDLPENALVAELLEKIGYWGLFQLRRIHKSQTNEQFVMKRTSNKTIPVLAKTIILGFSDCCKLSFQQQKTLYNGLIECMDNVMNHAYPPISKRKMYWLNKRWWALAYKNLKDKEVRLCFYDQGVGIPNTIRTRCKDIILNPMRSDEDIIVDAVRKGSYSRTKDITRGRGLPKLFAIIDGTNFSGDLSIYSDNSYCRFSSGNRIDKQSLPEKIDGTLITWRLSAYHEIETH